MMFYYGSPSELAQAFNALPDARKARAEQNSAWCGGSPRQAADMLISGDDSLVPEAERLLDQIDVPQVETLRTQWTLATVGAFPSVPHAIMGCPEAMYTRVNVPSDLAPVRVYACTTSSSALDAALLRRRGVAVLALVIAMSQLRPVELYTYTALDGYKGSATRPDKADAGACIIVTRICTTPLDLATACHALTSVPVDRGITHAIGYEHAGYTGAWAWNMPAYVEKSRALMRQCLDAQPLDVVIGATHVDDPAAINPVGFVRREVELFARQLEGHHHEI